MTPQEIVNTLSQRGFLLCASGENLHVKPTPDGEALAILHQHKAEIISFLAGGANRQPARQIPPGKIEEYSAPENFEAVFQKAMAAIGKVYREDLHKDQADKIRDEDCKLTGEINRLWEIGLAQAAAGNPEVRATFKEFRLAVTRWYHLWFGVIQPREVSKPAPIPVEGKQPPDDHTNLRTGRDNGIFGKPCRV